nr:Protein of unknown function (DUF2569) [uncultured bacterium]
MNQDQTPELKFKPVGSRPRGVGGWLAFFVIGQLVLRPLRTWNELNDPRNLVTPLFETNFPTTANIIGVERALIIGLTAFGIVVGLSLWKVRTPFSAKLTKIFLVVNPIIFLLSAVAFKFSDLPPKAQNEVMQHGLFETGVLTAVCLVWFLYFTKSERVRATYYDEGDSLVLR